VVTGRTTSTLALYQSGQYGEGERPTFPPYPAGFRQGDDKGEFYQVACADADPSPAQPDAIAQWFTVRGNQTFLWVADGSPETADVVSSQRLIEIAAGSLDLPVPTVTLNPSTVTESVVNLATWVATPPQVDKHVRAAVEGADLGAYGEIDAHWAGVRISVPNALAGDVTCLMPADHICVAGGPAYDPSVAQPTCAVVFSRSSVHLGDPRGYLIRVEGLWDIASQSSENPVEAPYGPQRAIGTDTQTVVREVQPLVR
jgi:hypothetical protein